MDPIYIGLLLAVVVALLALWWTSSRADTSLPPTTHTPEVGHTAPVAKLEGPSWSQRLNLGLSRARQDVWGKLLSAVGKNQGSFDEAEEILYTADLPPALVSELIASLQKNPVTDEIQLKNTLATFLKAKLSPYHPAEKSDPLRSNSTGKPRVVMIVGVNGAGKTTTVGKLAAKLRGEGSKVLVGACDTFRAAAVDQLQVWCDRAGADMVRAKDGADPSGVAFDTVARAQREGHDFCLVDTAGRLHTASGLMDELAKTKRVMSKVDPSFPQEVWLVIDAITGQNALKQAAEFHKTLGLTGLVFTKCDGSAKAGSAVAIVQQLQVPITYIGVGESVEDLQPFSVDEYVGALVGLSENQIIH
jgi:fused signal recognition particle receptor